MKTGSSSCFSFHNLFVDDDGDVYTFGKNNNGQCGTPCSHLPHEKPTKIMNNPNIRAIALGSTHYLFLEQNGDLYCFGNNNNKQIGPNITTYQKPYLPITFLAPDILEVCTTNTFTIIQKTNREIFWFGFWNNMKKENKGVFEKIQLEDVVSFSCGEQHCLFLKDNGEVWVMGCNKFLQCGYSRDTKYLATPQLLMTDKNIFDICCGYKNSFVLRYDEKRKTVMTCFGFNGFGQLGKSNKITQFEPFSDTSFSNLASVHCGENHTLLLTRNGDVYSAGYNDFGQLGLGKFSRFCAEFTKLSINNIAHIKTGFPTSVFVNNK
eukprot:TRINITY_DN12606_c0_g1_i1.p1 TRINITY_DN12606_c0_g1~~TRINITY_DN12606_c0_g1_i1.p1  ORF type:complete len:321 (-),score=46.53 TRINITY_DN12606_c0_g1_i1:28-990(-)